MSFLHRMNSSEEGMRNPFSDIRGLMSQAAAIGRDRTATIRSPVLWLALCGGLLVAGIFIGTTMMVGGFPQRAPHKSERGLQNTVLLLPRHFDHQFEEPEKIPAQWISQRLIS